MAVVEVRSEAHKETQAHPLAVERSGSCPLGVRLGNSSRASDRSSRGELALMALMALLSRSKRTLLRTHSLR